MATTVSYKARESRHKSPGIKGQISPYPMLTYRQPLWDLGGRRIEKTPVGSHGSKGSMGYGGRACCHLHAPSAQVWAPHELSSSAQFCPSPPFLRLLQPLKPVALASVTPLPTRNLWRLGAALAGCVSAGDTLLPLALKSRTTRLRQSELPAAAYHRHVRLGSWSTK